MGTKLREPAAAKRMVLAAGVLFFKKLENGEIDVRHNNYAKIGVSAFGLLINLPLQSLATCACRL
ncbi:MAG: hypothetical protein ACI898_000872 [Flavobacteriales bacterium]|jgi:hypothetical protein